MQLAASAYLHDLIVLFFGQNGVISSAAGHLCPLATGLKQCHLDAAHHPGQVQSLSLSVYNDTSILS